MYLRMVRSFPVQSRHSVLLAQRIVIDYLNDNIKFNLCQSNNINLNFLDAYNWQLIKASFLSYYSILGIQFMNRLQKQLLAHSFLRYYLRIFHFRKVPEPQRSLAIIVQHAFYTFRKKKPKIQISRVLRLAVSLCQKRQHHYPIQYLLGEWPFRYLNLKLKPPILVPRFQTQNMVSLILAQVRQRWKKGAQITFVDFGCGSGAIGLSLFQQLQGEYELKGIFVDISSECIALTKQNAAKNGLPLQKMQFVCEDMLKTLNLINQCQLVVSNPPYLQQKHYCRLQRQVRRYESKLALVSGSTGIQLVKPLAQAIMDAQRMRDDLLGAIEYGGEDVSCFGAEQYVVADQYERRRYLIFR